MTRTTGGMDAGHARAGGQRSCAKRRPEQRRLDTVPSHNQAGAAAARRSKLARLSCESARSIFAAARSRMTLACTAQAMPRVLSHGDLADAFPHLPMFRNIPPICGVPLAWGLQALLKRLSRPQIQMPTRCLPWVRLGVALCERSPSRGGGDTRRAELRSDRHGTSSPDITPEARTIAEVSLS